MVTQLTHLEFGMVVELSYNGSMESLDGLEGESIEDSKNGVHQTSRPHY